MVVLANTTTLSLILIGLLWERRRAKRAERFHSVTESRLTLAVESAGIGVWEWDVGHDTLWMDQRASQIHEVGQSDPTKGLGLLCYLHVDDRADVEKTLTGLSSLSPDFTLDCRIALKNERIRFLVMRGRGRFDSVGRLVIVTGISVDITDRRCTGLELEQRRTELAHATRALTVNQLTGSLAHELNQPLSAISANSAAGMRFLQQVDPNLAEVREVLTDIAADANRAGTIIHRLRSLLRKKAVDQEQLDLSLMISETVELLHTDFILKGVSIQWKPVATPAVNGDRVQLQQVLVNLLINAAEAMATSPSVHRVVRINAGASESGGAWVTVEDRGKGFPAERLTTPFEPFCSTKPNGLGLGLSICHAIMKMHGGAIDIAANTTGCGVKASLHFLP